MGLTPLAVAADEIIKNLPPGSFTNPIGKDPAYPYPHNPADEAVVDTQYGGHRFVPYYEVHPVLDKSGLVEWTGPDTSAKAKGLTAAQNLAVNVMWADGDRSSFADYNSGTQADGSYRGAGYINPNAILPTEPPRFTPLAGPPAPVPVAPPVKIFDAGSSAQTGGFVATVPPPPPPAPVATVPPITPKAPPLVNVDRRADPVSTVPTPLPVQPATIQVNVPAAPVAAPTPAAAAAPAIDPKLMYGALGLLLVLILVVALRK